MHREAVTQLATQFDPTSARTSADEAAQGANVDSPTSGGRSPAGGPDGVSQGEKPLFGRERELEQVRSALATRDIVGVLLAGLMGTGKSTLLDRAVVAAVQDGNDVIRLHASKATSTIPLFVFAEIGGDAGNDTQRYQAVRDELRARRNGGRPVVLAVDDIQELDDASAALAVHIARERTVTLLGSVRSSEPIPEPIAALWSQGLAQRIEISNLHRGDAAEVAADLLGGPVDPELEGEIWRRTAGNPLHVRELVLGSMAAGVVHEVDGVWTRTDRLVATDALIDLVKIRVADLSPDEQRALCAVALAEPVSASLVEQVASRDALIALEEAGLVRVRADRRRLLVRLAHPIYGEAVRSFISQLRVRQLRLDLASAVRGSGSRRRDDLIQVAHWRLDSGDPDPDLFAIAAFEAIRRHDFDLAAELAEAAHSMQPDGRATRALAMTRHLAGRHEGAVAVLANALADPATDELEASRLQLLRGLVLARGLGDYEGATRALQAVHADNSERVQKRTAAMMALISLLQGDAAQGLAAATPLVGDLPEPEAVSARVGSLAVSGLPGAALAEADAFIAAHGEPDSRSLFPDFRWVALIDAGGVVQMDLEVAAAWARAVDDGDRHRQARLAFATGHVRIERGQLVEAIAWFERAAGLSRSVGERFGVRWARCGQLLAAGLAADLVIARAAVAELDRVPGHPAELFEIYGIRGRALLTALEGRSDEARSTLLDLAERLLAMGCVTHAVRALIDAARLGAATEANALLRLAAPGLDGELMPRCASLLAAAASADVGQLAALSAELEAMGHVGLAATAATIAHDVLMAVGRSGDAAEWSLTARRLLGTDANDTTDSVVGTSGVVSLLTRREREIAHLVSQGLTSKEVAENCFLSVRTVDNHLSRIYDKLGVRSRGELTTSLGPLMIGAG